MSDPLPDISPGSTGDFLPAEKAKVRQAARTGADLSSSGGPRSTRRWRYLAVLGLAAAIVLLALAFGQGWSLAPLGGRSLFEEATATEPPYPTYAAAPVFSATDAISRSIASLPPGFAHSAVVTRLISDGTLTSWRRGAASPFVPDESPVWLVGLAVGNMTVGQAMPREYGPGAIPAYPAPDDPLAYTAQTLTALSVMPVQGMYFAWNANSGDQLGMGVLGPPWPQTLESIAALPEEVIPITAATEVVLPTEEW